MQIKQNSGESLRQYLQWWNKEVIKAESEDKIAVPAFINGLSNTEVAYDLNKIDIPDVSSLVREVRKHMKTEAAVDVLEYGTLALRPRRNQMKNLLTYHNKIC